MSKRRRTSARIASSHVTAVGRQSTRVEDLCEGVIEAGWLLALALVPLCFNIYSARTFEPDKIALLRSLVLVMIAAWLWKVLSGGRPWRPAGGGRFDDEAVPRPNRGGWLATVRQQPLLALIALLAAALVLGSLLSVDQRLSWHGSYPRFQGSWSQLSYLAIFALTATHLRSRDQWRRVVFVMLITSVPITLYALFQAAGLDPLPHDIGTQRAFSTLGNPIFLGAYLLMVFFLTLLELGQSAARLWQRRAMAPAITTATLAGIAMLQIAALISTQSRGPFLGMLGGGYLFFLALTLVSRSRSLASSESTGWLSLYRRWIWLVVVAIAVIAAAFLVTLNLPDSPLEELKRAPYLGRLGSILDFESNTVQVRLLIWEGVISVLTSEEPLSPPGGPPDRLEPVRALIGYGPETLPLVINRFTPPELGQREGRADVPDRAHNETFDALVMHGAIGYATWLTIACTAFFLGLKFLGLVESTPQRLSFWLNLCLGGALGVLGPQLLQGEWTLSGVGLAAGIVAGLLVFVTLEALIGGRSVAVGKPLAEIGLVVALMATLAAHVVEIHFGIAIASTRLYFWLLLSALLVLSRGWMSLAEFGDSDAAEVATAAGTPGPRRRPKAKTSLPDVHVPLQGVIAGLLVTAICAPLSYGLMLNPDRLTETIPLLVANLYATQTGSIFRPGTLAWILILTLTAAAVLSTLLVPTAEPRRTKHHILLTSFLGMTGIAAWALLQARLVAGVSRFRLTGGDSLDAALSGANVFSAFTWLMILLLLVIAFLIGWRRADLRVWSQRGTAVSVACGMILAVGTVWLINTANLDPIRADTLLKEARAFTTAGRPEVGVRLLDKACDLDPKEPMYFLYRGQAAMRAASVAATNEERAELREAAEATLARARELAPLDPDHSANLARFSVRRAADEDESRTRAHFLDRAEAEYRNALLLRPSSVLLMNELAPVLMQLDQIDEAEELVVRALALDDRYTRSYYTLGTILQTKAVTASTMRQPAAFSDYIERAAALYERAILFRPPIEAAAKELEKLEPLRARMPSQRLTPDRLLDLYGADPEVHFRVARYHLEGGRGQRALTHARVALDLAGKSRRVEALSLVREVEEAVSARR